MRNESSGETRADDEHSERRLVLVLVLVMVLVPVLLMRTFFFFGGEAETATHFAEQHARGATG